MLEHVYRGTAACRMLDEVVVATCDDEIACAARRFGARVVMTSPSHTRASDRVAEAAADDRAEIVVMVQGDEPMVQPSMIAAALEPMIKDGSVSCVNLAATIRTAREFEDPNTIKVVRGLDGGALYFSRQPIPSAAARPSSPGQWLKQVCVIPFRREALHAFASLRRGPLEEAESIDMLRFLENGIRVQIVPIEVDTQSVDTPEDLARVETLIAGQSWV